MESTGFRGTRTVNVPGNGNQIYNEPEQFLFQEMGNQIYKVLEWSSSGTQVLDRISFSWKGTDRSVILTG